MHTKLVCIKFVRSKKIERRNEIPYSYEELKKMVEVGSHGTQRLMGMRGNLYVIKDYNDSYSHKGTTTYEKIVEAYDPKYGGIPPVGGNPVWQLRLLQLGVIVISGLIIFAAYEIMSRLRPTDILYGALIVAAALTVRYLSKGIIKK